VFDFLDELLFDYFSTPCFLSDYLVDISAFSRSEDLHLLVTGVFDLFRPEDC